jgi:hypothetical protein
MKPASAFYKQQKRKRTVGLINYRGRKSKCHKCQQAYAQEANRKSYLKHRGDRLSAAKLWKKRNRDRANQNSRLWIRANRAKHSMHVKAWRCAHPERLEAYIRTKSASKRLLKLLSAASAISKTINTNQNEHISV